MLIGGEETKTTSRFLILNRFIKLEKAKLK
jgi:hypothetical protein